MGSGSSKVPPDVEGEGNEDRAMEKQGHQMSTKKGLARNRKLLRLVAGECQ